MACSVWASCFRRAAATPTLVHERRLPRLAAAGGGGACPACPPRSRSPTSPVSLGTSPSQRLPATLPQPTLESLELLPPQQQQPHARRCCCCWVRHALYVANSRCCCYSSCFCGGCCFSPVMSGQLTLMAALTLPLLLVLLVLVAWSVSCAQQPARDSCAAFGCAFARVAPFDLCHPAAAASSSFRSFVKALGLAFSTLVQCRLFSFDDSNVTRAHRTVKSSLIGE